MCQRSKVKKTLRIERRLSSERALWPSAGAGTPGENCSVWVHNSACGRGNILQGIHNHWPAPGCWIALFMLPTSYKNSPGDTFKKWAQATVSLSGAQGQIENFSGETHLQAVHVMTHAAIHGVPTSRMWLLDDQNTFSRWTHNPKLDTQEETVRSLPTVRGCNRYPRASDDTVIIWRIREKQGPLKNLKGGFETMKEEGDTVKKSRKKWKRTS